MHRGLDLTVLFSVWFWLATALANSAELSIVERNAVVKEFAKCAAYYEHTKSTDKVPTLKRRAIALLDSRNTGQIKRFERSWNSMVRAESKRVAWLIRSDPADLDYLHNEFSDRCATMVSSETYDEALSRKAGMVQRSASNADQSRQTDRERNLRRTTTQHQKKPTTRQANPRRTDRRRPAQDGPQTLEPQALAALAASDPNGLAGEWRGYYQCEGDWEIFMRLSIVPDNKTYSTRFDFGSGLRGMVQSGAANMSTVYTAAGAGVVFTMQDWIVQPSRVDPYGFSGQMSADKTVISGQVTGKPNCSTFSVTKKVPSAAPVNEDGLLFQYQGPRDITATEGQCRAYVAWLSSENDEPFKGAFEYRYLRDQNEMRRILGKDISQWGSEDWRSMQALARHCRALLESRQDPELDTLIARLNKNYGTWAPRPLLSPKYDRNGLLSNHWLAAEQAVMANDTQRALAVAVLGDIDAMPPTITTVQRIDQLLGELRNTSHNQNRFKQLSINERQAYIEDLREAYREKGVDAANQMANSWHSEPQTVDGLRAVQARFEADQKKLKAIQLPEADETLVQRYKETSQLRAVALWPEWIRASIAGLNGLREADLSEFRTLSDLRADRAFLASIKLPAPIDAFYTTYQSAERSFRGTVDRMIDRSGADISEWINSMPASATAGEVLDQFILEVFESDKIPARQAGLRDMIYAKKRAYNPADYRRPDIVLAVMRKHWREVRLESLDDLAYFWTALRSVRDGCPRTIPNGGPLVDFSLSFANSAVQRAMSGNASRADAARLMFLFANALINQPGCTINEFGIVTGCSTQEGFEAGQAAVMTSASAIADLNKLTGANGCGSDGASRFIQNLEIYAGSRYSLPLYPEIPDFWNYVQ